MAALWARDTSLHARALAAAPAPVDPPPLTQPADTFAPDALRFVVYGCLPPDTLINLLTRPAFDILIIERDIAQFRRLLQLFDISSPLAHPRVRWCVSDDPVAISNAFYTWCHDLGSIAIHAIPPPASPDHAFYHALHERLDLVTARVQQDLATYRQNAEIFFRSAMANVNRVLTSHDLNPVTAWTAHHPPPALVLGAGPSLDDGLDSIAAFRARGWIVCTDSAWPALARRGIVPDCICTIDYSPRKASVFSAHPPGDILVVSVPDAFPDLLEHAKRLSFVSRGVPLSDRIGALVGGLPRFDEPISDVTQFAFLVARRLLGARAITLLGCDLCVKGDAHHARDAVAHATAPANASIKAPGVSGEVTTTPAFLNSRDVLTQYAAAALATTPPRTVSLSRVGSISPSPKRFHQKSPPIRIFPMHANDSPNCP